MLNFLFGEPGNRAFVASFHDRGDVWPECHALGHAPLPAGLHAGGLISGTLVATEHGWRTVDRIAPGDQVLTFDHGLIAVHDVRRRSLAPVNAHEKPEMWCLHVPPGALGNRSAFGLLPSQNVLIESDLAEAMLGDPFVMMTAQSLLGFSGITRARLDPMDTVATLVFEHEQVVHVAGSALLHCPGAPDAVRLPEGPAQGNYPRLSPLREQQLATWMKRGETCASLHIAQHQPRAESARGQGVALN